MKLTIIDKKGEHFALGDAYTVLVSEPDGDDDEKISQVIVDTDEGVKHSSKSQGMKDLLKDRPGINFITHKDK